MLCVQAPLLSVSVAISAWSIIEDMVRRLRKPAQAMPLLGTPVRVMRQWQSLAAVVGLSSAVACATGVRSEAPAGDSGGSEASGGSGDIVGPTAGDGSLTGGSTSIAGTTSAGGQLAFGGSTGMPGGAAGKAGTGGTSGAAGAHSGGSSGTSSGGVSGVGGTGAGGTSGTGCMGLPMWDGGNYMFTLKMGDEIQWKGKKYKAAQAISFPNTDCAPDAPAAYCSGWFTSEGSC
jgi:hypothetical protein